MNHEGLHESKGRKAASLSQLVSKIQTGKYKSRQTPEFKVSLGHQEFGPRCGGNGIAGQGPTQLVIFCP